jgi:hypothetical protein
MTTPTGTAALEHEIGTTGEFSLMVPSGEVELHGTDASTARVTDLDGHDLEERFDVHRGPGSLSLRLRDRASIGLGFLRGGGKARFRLRVDLPRGATVDVNTASGTVDASRLSGAQHYKSASGDIHVAGSGTLTIDSVSGDIRLDADGDVELASRVVSGDITVHGGRLRSALVTTTSGDITLDSELAGPGPYGIQTVSGDAIVRAGDSLKVEAKTLTGRVESAVAAVFGKRESRRGGKGLVIGDGRTILTFKSISGDLRVADSMPASGASVSHDAPEPPASVGAAPTPPEPPDAPLPPAPPAQPLTPPRPDAADTANADDARLAILRDLEDGRIDIDEAGARLAELDGDDDV